MDAKITELQAKLTAAEATVAELTNRLAEIDFLTDATKISTPYRALEEENTALRTRLDTARDLLTRIKEHLEARKVNVGLVFLPEIRSALDALREREK